MSERRRNPRLLPLIHERWSPRAFDGQPLDPEDLAVILEAGGLAPSAFNAQPWRFLYAINGDPHWQGFVDLLIPFNATWAGKAGALVFIVSASTLAKADGPAPLYSHSFDAGAAWATLALQALHMGYHTHGMTGIEFSRIPGALGLPEGYRVEAAIAIGRKAPADTLPEALAAREVPSSRKPLAEIAAAGHFSALQS